MNSTDAANEVLRRHALPEVLFAPDLAIVLDLPEQEADQGARSGRFGRQFFVQGRVAVLRQDFLDTLIELGETDEPLERELMATQLRAVRDTEGNS